MGLVILAGIFGMGLMAVGLLIFAVGIGMTAREDREAINRWYDDHHG